MKTTALLTALALCAASSAPMHAQDNLEARDTITDNHIVPPSSFDTDTRNLQDNWYLQRYAVLDSIARNANLEELTDEVCIARLQKMPTIIEMPYNSIVKSYIEMYANRKPELVEKMLGMSLFYMPIFEDALEKYQMPQELKYLPIVESALNPNAVSKAGACGLWQFMSSTAIGEGLEVNSLVDERRDPIASSQAAAHYLQTLYNIYGDWSLAIAAYNCGPGNVNKAISRAGGGKKDYWQIYFFLPEETRGYVPAFIAANYIMNYYAEHGISHALARRPMVTDTVHVNRRVHFQQIADVLDIPIDEIRILNPQYRHDIVPGNVRPYAITLPSVQAYCFAANQDTIFNHRRDEFIPRETVDPTDPNAVVGSDQNGQYVEDLHVVYHKVKKGETLKSIADSYGVTAESIRKANNLSSSRVKTGKTLKINTYTKRYVMPDKQDSSQDVAQGAAQPKEEAPAKKQADPKPQKQQPAKSKPAAPQPQTITHTVKSGESLDKISRKYGVTVKEIMTVNNLKSTTIHPNQKLKIPNKAAQKPAAKSGTSKSKKK